MSDHAYKVRYSIEPWNKPVPPREIGAEFAPGITKSKTDFGYTDILFIGSVLVDEEGEYSSIMLMSSEGNLIPSRKLLEAIKGQIEHMLEHHVKE